jgi:hypothetical protein
MIDEEFDPAPAMRPWIANLWRFEVEASDPEHFEHVIVPDVTLSISVTRMPSGERGPPQSCSSTVRSWVW